jgi:hypothetical protein
MLYLRSILLYLQGPSTKQRGSAMRAAHSNAVNVTIVFVYVAGELIRFEYAVFRTVAGCP